MYALLRDGALYTYRRTFRAALLFGARLLADSRPVEIESPHRRYHLTHVELRPEGADHFVRVRGGFVVAILQTLESGVCATTLEATTPGG